MSKEELRETVNHDNSYRARRDKTEWMDAVGGGGLDGGGGTAGSHGNVKGDEGWRKL